MDGALRCTEALEPQVEVCNGMDDDCDGAVDDEIVPSRTCYGGNLVDLVVQNTACRAGVLTCVNGADVCVNERRPTSEICNELDDDCNGVIDDVPTSTMSVGIDVVLVVDRSGSMAEEIATISFALTEFMQAHASDEFRYAVVDLPGAGSLTSSASLSLDLSPASTALQVVANLDASHGGEEPSYDALLWIVDGTLPISWRSGTRRVVFFFGDENAQSQSGLFEIVVALALAREGIVFFGFVDPRNFIQYDDIAAATGGNIFNLYTTAFELSQIFIETTQLGCAP